MASQLASLALAFVALPGAGDPWAALIEWADAEHGELGARAATFLAEHRPPRDAAIDLELVRENLDLALLARERFPWASSVPEDLFLDAVLPYAVLDETRERWRPEFLELATPIVADCKTATEAAQALNREFFTAINVHYNTGRKRPNQSPSESVAQGRATCTGLSIILVDACRAVGVPARAAGVASWHDKRGNHTWVEVWDGGWHFMGADEFDENGLDRGWFQSDAAKAVPGNARYAVWASSWKPGDWALPLVWAPDDKSVHAVDVTPRYLSKNPKSSAALAVRSLRLWRKAPAAVQPERLRAKVRVLNLDGTLLAEDETRAGRADLNDMPAFQLPPTGSYRLQFEYNGELRSTTLEAQVAGVETLDLIWEELESTVLDGETAEVLLRELTAIAQERLAAERAAEITNAAYVHAGHTLRILEKEFGDAPDGERSLWISMHGGGGAPTEVNDKQWQNQVRLYEPEEGIYVAPRAPTDSWNLWHQGHIDPLFDRLIETYVAARGVDPDRVYLLGYSAGGDGVYQLAPRMADRFAAASMMAGHPNEAQPLGLRNLPFALFMGGADGAYDRNKIVEVWGAQLDELAAADPGGYPHRLTVYPDTGHWMDGRDAEALPWMAEHTRSAWPQRLVWFQDDVTHTRFYWLAVAPEDAVVGRRISAEVTDIDGAQRIVIESPDTRSVTLRLRDTLVDLDRPLAIEANGAIVYEGLVARSRGAIERSLAERCDPRTAATAQLTVSW